MSEAASVHVLEATLMEVRPPVRRTLEVPSSMTLERLHLVLQGAFEWGDDHLHDFKVRGVRYTPAWAEIDEPMPFGDASRYEETAVLGLLGPRPGDVIDYLYDFGDCWRHRIEVVSVDAAKPDAWYPSCTGGKGMAPAEHTGNARPDRFGDAVITRVNDRLRLVGAETGSNLPAIGTPVDQPFTGLFPNLEIARSGPCPCGCGEMLEGDRHDPLPARRAVSHRQLAEAAAGSLLVGRARHLAAWVGQGRALTPSRMLRPAEALQVHDALGLAGGARPQVGAAGAEPGGDQRGDRRIRSAKDLPGLQPLWVGCLRAGLIEVQRGKARTGPELAVWQEGADPDLRMESWCALVSGWLQAGSDATSGARDRRTRLARELQPAVVPVLYRLAQQPVPRAKLALALNEWANGLDPYFYQLSVLEQLPLIATETASLVEDWLAAGVLEAADLTPEQSDELSEEMAELERSLLPDLPALGSYPEEVEIFLTPVRKLASELRSGSGVKLTALGSYGLARLLAAHGWEVPTVDASGEA